MERNLESKVEWMKRLRFWGFSIPRIATVFQEDERVAQSMLRDVKVCEVGLVEGDGWLMNELLKSGFTAEEIATLFNIPELSVRTYVKKWRKNDEI